MRLHGLALLAATAMLSACLVDQEPIEEDIEDIEGPATEALATSNVLKCLPDENGNKTTGGIVDRPCTCPDGTASTKVCTYFSKVCFGGPAGVRHLYSESCGACACVGDIGGGPPEKKLP